MCVTNAVNMWRSRIAVIERECKRFAIGAVSWNRIQQARRLTESVFRASASRAFCAKSVSKRAIRPRTPYICVNIGGRRREQRALNDWPNTR